MNRIYTSLFAAIVSFHCWGSETGTPPVATPQEALTVQTYVDCEAMNLINAEVKQKLLEAVTHKFVKLQQEFISNVGQQKNNFGEYCLMDRTFHHVLRRVYTSFSGKDEVSINKAWDTLPTKQAAIYSIRQAYEAAINADLQCIILLTRKDQGTNFWESTFQEISKISQNPVGAQLLIDILVENSLNSDPVIIVPHNFFVGMEAHNLKIKKGEQQIITASIWKDVCCEQESCFAEKSDDVCNIIYLNLAQNFTYSGVNICHMRKKITLSPIRDITTCFEVDIILFHELNHYRHYLQEENKTVYTNRRYSECPYYFQSQVNTNGVWSCNIDLMRNREEEFQLIGMTLINETRQKNIKDIVSENLYRYKRNLLSNRKRIIRLPYYYINSEYIQKLKLTNIDIFEALCYYEHQTI